MEKGPDAFTSWDNKISSSSSSSSSSNSAAAKPHTTTTTTTTTSTTTNLFLSKGFINLDPPFQEAVANINNRDDTTVWSSSHCSTTTHLQPFDMFPPASSAYSTKSPAGFPFTSAQWGELERQAMIYKYIMCCVPVPPDLLFPLIRNSSSAAAAAASPLYNVRYARNGDPEPGRCKRTDGKKWRCSRDVASHQKYCERHLHRGRPRSRKPVEVKNSCGTNGGGGESSSTHKKTRLHPVSLATPTPASSHQLHLVSATATATPNDSPPLLLNSKTDVTISNRDLGLIMEADEQQRLQLLMGPNIGFTGEGSSSIHGSATLFDQDYLDHHQHHHHPLNVFTAPGIEAQAGFIDAWSIENNNLNSTNNGNTESTNQGSLSPSLNLSMTMAVGNPLDQGLGKVQLESYEDHITKNWLGHHVLWQPFAQGGPLAEALHLGSVYANPTPASPHDSIGTPATTVSSPSGVLQRTFFSHSDGSVCNSPTFAAHASEVVFPRFNQND